MAKKHQPPAQFPVALFKLDPDNIGYDRDKRYRIDTVDETCFYFKTQAEAEEFMRIHGLRHVEAAEVAQLRKAMQTKPDDPDDWQPDGGVEDEGPVA